MSNTNRTDVHAPSNINPADYTFSRVFWLCPPKEICFFAALEGMSVMDAFRKEQAETKAMVEAEGWKGGNYAAKRTCDHCGARFNYGVVYRHNPTNELIVVGWICAEKTMDCDSRVELEYNRLVQRVHNMRKHVKAQQALTKRKNDLLALYPDMVELLECGHRIVQDIRSRFETTGYLSVAQMNLVRKLYAEEVHGAEKPEPKWLPVEEGRRELEGQILATKLVDGYYGSTYKMLVQIDRPEGSEKVWVTMPSNLIGQGEKKGKKVRFTCTVEKSQKDPTFGIGKRPTGASLLN
jgi:hypothetical protein